MDAITMLTEDHDRVKKLFDDYEKTGDRAFVTRRRLIDQISEELSVHTAIEEQIFYPVTRETVPGAKAMALESIEEHAVVKWLLSELADVDPGDERFHAKVTVLIENVRHHIAEEESDYFTLVRDELAPGDFEVIGDALADAKKNAPTHPHPRSPSTGPENRVIGGLAATADRLLDTVSGIGQGAVSVVADLIDRIRGVDPSRPGPTGTSTARRTATVVRDRVGSSVDDVVAAVKGARTTGETTVDAAASAAEDVIDTARSSGRKTAETAKRSAAQTRR